jgi:hypothetical protein
MATVQDYENLLNQVAALRETLTDQIASQVNQNPQLADDIVSQLDDMLKAYFDADRGRPAPNDLGLAELVGVGDEAADELAGTRLPANVVPYDERVTSERIIAVDAVGSRVFGNTCAKRRIPGHGAAFRPPLCRPELIDRYVEVTDRDCVAGCRRLLRREAILAGGSSGAVVSAAARLQAEIPPGSTCALIFPDRGERYLDTIYSDEWVRNELGSLPE